MLVPILCFSPIINQAQAETYQKKENNVILISFDGMRNDLTNKYVHEGKLPHIKKLIDRGMWAKNPSTITPSLTAPSHAAISTGATPKQTGVVSNQWHDPNKRLQNTDDAFHAKLEVAPIWVEAREQGKKTATIAFPGANPAAGKQGDYSIYYGETWSPSSLESLRFKPSAGWGNLPESFSSLKEAEMPIKMEKEKIE
jgi:hypothetical protein